MYVDDIIFGATNEKMCDDFSKLMESEFEMSMMGELKFFLGLQIKQHKDGIFICQENYVKDFPEKECRGMIRSLLYLTTSRPDNVFAVGLCARFQTAPKESHYTAVKRMFRYLVGTPSVGLWYKKGSHFNLTAYFNADYAGDKIERKSTSGACQLLGEALVSWCC